MDVMELKSSEALIRMLTEAKARTPSEEELRKQRVSFVYGCVDEKSGITHERIQSVLNVQDGKVTG